MTARDLPELATPWTDPLGVTWCVVASEEPGWVVVHRADAAQKPSYIGSGAAVQTWKVNADFLKCLGRTLPPVPTPQRMARMVKVEGTSRWYAVKGETLYTRIHGFPWEQRSNVPAGADYLAAALAASEGAGDVLPGEETTDA